MPKKPLRPCSHPGCPNLCEGQFCEQHRVEERRRYDKYERSSDVNRKYGRAWKRIRDPVSYTHLVGHLGALDRTMLLGIAEVAACEEVAALEDVHAVPILREPVSYTHLDVYKRQPQ